MEEYFFVYAVINTEDVIYIGYTSDLKKRLERHNGERKTKKASFTSRRKQGEWRLIYRERCDTRKEALKRERQLKSFRGREFIRSLIVS